MAKPKQQKKCSVTILRIILDTAVIVFSLLVKFGVKKIHAVEPLSPPLFRSYQNYFQFDFKNHNFLTDQKHSLKNGNDSKCRYFSQRQYFDYKDRRMKQASLNETIQQDLRQYVRTAAK